MSLLGVSSPLVPITIMSVRSLLAFSPMTDAGEESSLTTSPWKVLSLSDWIVTVELFYAHY